MRVSLLTTICITLLAIGCAPSQQEDRDETKYPDLVQINLPDDAKQEKSQVYIDAVEKTWQDGNRTLLIRGTFPDACTHIQSASHSLDSDTITIKIAAWREINTMCAQALTSFSFIYRQIPDSLLEDAKEVTVNSKTYKIP